MEKRSRTGGNKPTKKGETERRRRRRRENQEKKKRYTIKLSPNLLKFIRYGSCNLLSYILCDLGNEKIKKNHEGMPRIFTPALKET
jgi:hypothetical protein